MKLLFKINLWGIIITALLYLTLFGGVLSQIIMGFIQLTCFIIILISKPLLTKTQRIHLWVYGVITGIIIVGAILFTDPMLLVLWLGSIPLLFYFLYILHLLKNLDDEL